MKKILKFIVLIMILALIISMPFNLTKFRKKKMLYITLFFFFYSIWSTFIYWIDISFKTTFMSNWKMKKINEVFIYFLLVLKCIFFIQLMTVHYSSNLLIPEVLLYTNSRYVTINEIYSTCHHDFNWKYGLSFTSLLADFFWPKIFFVNWHNFFFFDLNLNSNFFLINTILFKNSLLSLYPSNIMIKIFNISFLYDNLSIYFIVLTTFLIPICILVSWNTYTFVREYLIVFFVLEIFLILTFLSGNLIMFYVSFEAILLPMFIIILLWGSRKRKIGALYQLFIYTIFGSVYMLFSILLIKSQVYSTDLNVLLYIFDFSYYKQLLLFTCFFFPFAIKIPIIPVHIWLPEAHVEAPTFGSVILAGLLLKLGGYGILRFILPIFPAASLFFSPLILIFNIISIIYISLVTIRQIDFKKIIAYSSVAHMNLVNIGLFSFNLQSLEGAMFLMISHAIVSSGLFICVGTLYERYHTRILYYYSGLVITMPLFSFFFFLFILSNIGFPGSSNFIGELLILLGGFENNSTIIFLQIQVLCEAQFILFGYLIE